MNWNNYFSSLQEIEAYQRKVRKGYVKDRDMYLKGGPPGKHSVTGNRSYTCTLLATTLTCK